MKKIFYKMVTIFLSIIVFTITTFAVSPRWTYVAVVAPEIYKSGDEYEVEVDAVSSVIKIEATLIISERNSNGTYTEKDRTTGSVNGASGTIAGEYDFDSNKTYKLSYMITVTTSNGAKETVSGSCVE